jgi:hypothetical protein
MAYPPRLKYVLQPCFLLNPHFPSNDILLVGFGCAFPLDSPPLNPDIYLTTTASVPEVIFASEMSVCSDI